MDEMTKIAAAVPGVLHEAAEFTRKLASANLDLVRERDGALHQLRLMKLAQRMHERGIDPHLSFDEKVEHLGQHEATKIAAFEAGLSLVGGGSLSLGQLEEKTAGETHGASTGLTQEGLNDFILNLGGFDR
jgi:hypothetical protein